MKYPLFAATKPKGRSPAAALLLLTLFMACLTGCSSTQKKQAQDLVKAGSATSEQLDTYYTTLARERGEYLTLFRLELKLSGSLLDPGLETSFREQEAALDSRARLAAQLQTSYEKLGKLIDYDASGEVRGAVEKLRAAIEDANHHPLKIQGLPLVGDVTAYFNNALVKLVEIQQLQDFRRKAPLVQAVLENIRKVYDAEKPLYVMIAQDYEKETWITAKYLLNSGQATGIATLQPFVESYGLAVKAPATPDPNVKSWTLDRITEVYEARKKRSVRIADAIGDSLADLVQAHDDFLHKKKPQTGTMQAAARANRLLLAQMAGRPDTKPAGKEKAR